MQDFAAVYCIWHLQAAVRNMRSRKEPRQPPSTLFKALIEMGGASAQVTFVPEPSQQSKSSRSTGTDKHNIHLQLPGVPHVRLTSIVMQPASRRSCAIYVVCSISRIVCLRTGGTSAYAPGDVALLACCMLLVTPLAGVIHPLWSHSYLGYGFDVVEKEVKQLILQQDSNHDSGSAAVESHQHGSQQQQQQSAQQFTASLRSPTIMDPCLPVG